ncbi:hypothetical protein ACOMHN_042191 [Nucella lapillus]
MKQVCAEARYTERPYPYVSSGGTRYAADPLCRRPAVPPTRYAADPLCRRLVMPPTHYAADPLCRRPAVLLSRFISFLGGIFRFSSHARVKSDI